MNTPDKITAKKQGHQLNTASVHRRSFGKMDHNGRVSTCIAMLPVEKEFLMAMALNLNLTYSKLFTMAMYAYAKQIGFPTASIEEVEVKKKKKKNGK